ncbi:MAG: molecular chaperone DjlA [Flavobacteriales bacterium]|nr:molecular chaperone DjlA [Flavobacteriales bacterium]
MSLGKYLGIGAGWFLAGPIGAIVGYYIGKNFFDGNNNNAQAYEISLLILSSLVIKSDGKIVDSELTFVRNFFVKTFGTHKANKYFKIFNRLNKESLESKLRPVCQQITANVNHASRLQIIHFLFGVSASDNHIDSSEIMLIKKISTYFNINSYDFESIKSMFLKNNNSSDISKWYKILEIDEHATTQDIKKAYRKMAMKFHPDKLQNVSLEIKKLAEEKFLAIKEAYDNIMKIKGK